MTTARLPKQYFIHKPGHPRQSTCMINVDALNRPEAPDYDFFRLGRVVFSAIVITSHCIGDEGRIGLDFPGSNQAVFIKVERIDQLPLIQNENGIQNSYNVTLGNSTLELRELSSDIDSRLYNPVDTQTS